MKITVVFFLSLLASHQVLATHQEDLTARSLKDEFAKIIKGIISLIEMTLSSIINEIDKAIKKIGNILKDGASMVENTIGGILNIINDLEMKALDLGVDIAECVVDNKKLILKFKDNTIAKLHKNANRIINGVNKIKDEAVETIQGYINVVYTLLDNFTDCSIINIICMSKVIVKATATSIELTVKLPLVAARIIKTVGVIVVGGVADISSITTDFSKTSSKLLLRVTSCVTEKLPIGNTL